MCVPGRPVSRVRVVRLWSCEPGQKPHSCPQERTRAGHPAFSMTKRKRRKHKSNKVAVKPQSTDRQSWFSNLPTIWKVLIFIFSIPSLYVGVLATVPRISVKPVDSLEPSGSFSASFVVSNDGYLGVHGIKVSCAIDDIENSGHDVLTNSLAGELVNLEIGDLGPDGGAITMCQTGIFTSAPIVTGHINIVISFRPDFLPWHQTKDFHFTAFPGEHDSIHWIQTSK